MGLPHAASEEPLSQSLPVHASAHDSWKTSPDKGRFGRSEFKKIVGFKANGNNSRSDELIKSGFNDVEANGSVIRKRLLSPLTMFFPERFGDDPIDEQTTSDSKKANITGRLRRSPVTTTTATSSCGDLEGFSSMVFSDGLLLGSRWSRELNKPSPSLSLSPLRPRFSEGGNGKIPEDDHRVNRRLFEDANTLQGSIKSDPSSPSRRFCRGRPTQRPLVGSFEESLLSGRLSYAQTNQRIDGFLAVLSIAGGNFSPKSQKLPFSVTSVDGDSSLLYYASIDLAGSSPNKPWCQKIKMGHRLRVPMKGRIQLVLSNPEKTPLHTFLCDYDLTEMPAGTKTFFRQKVTLATFVNEAAENTLSSDKDCGGSGHRELDDMYILRHETYRETRQRCSKAKECNSGSGALRYALHLRFICPLPKKASKSGHKCKSDDTPLKQSLDEDKERRFYLYNDLRVVFPQRHADSDEGKLNAEYHYPENPRYFDITN